MFKNKILYLIKLSLIIIASNVAIYSNSFALFTYQGDVEPSNINELNGSIFFFSQNYLWKSDGLPNGKLEALAFVGNDTESSTTKFIKIKKLAIFSDYPYIWRTDGTKEGTYKLNTDKSSIGLFHSTVVNDVLYFIGNDHNLWRTDGEIVGKVSKLPSSSCFLNNINNTLYYACDANNSFELWISDGTEIGTRLVKSIPKGKDLLFIEKMKEFNGKAYFFAEDDTHGLELWVSDGTEQGTHMVIDVNATSESSILYHTPNLMSIKVSILTVANNKLYFIANDGIHGYELWQSDGTTLGTKLVKDIIPGLESTFTTQSLGGSSLESVDSNYDVFIGLNDYLYFYAYKQLESSPISSSSNRPRFLWKTDGTEANTSIIADSGNSTELIKDINNLTRVNNYIIFTAQTDSTGFEFWQTDGTVSGTKIIKDFNVAQNPNNMDGTDGYWGRYVMLSFNNKAYFFARSSGGSNYNLYAFDPSSNKLDSILPTAITNYEAISHPENKKTILNLNKIGGSYTYDLGGRDASKFSIDDQGNLNFIEPPDFEKLFIYNYEVAIKTCDSNENCILKGYTITITDQKLEPLQLTIKTFLQGAYDASTGLMRDDLRQQAYLPIESPYFTQTQVTDELNPALLARSDDTAPVDWVLIELRDKTDKTKVVATKSALIQRNGQVIDPQTGSQTLSWDTVAAGDYFVAIKHRNHLGIMSNNTVALGTSVVTLDFTNPSLETLGMHSRLIVGDKALMWAGDSNQDGMLIANGNNSDATTILGNLLMDPLNTDFNSNYMLSGYFEDDINMDGSVFFAGPNNDITPLIANILVHPDNTETAGNYIVKAGF